MTVASPCGPTLARLRREFERRRSGERSVSLCVSSSCDPEGSRAPASSAEIAEVAPYGPRRSPGTSSSSTGSYSSSSSISSRSSPAYDKHQKDHWRGTDATYEVTEDVQELNEVVKHFRLLITTLLGLHREIIASEAARFMYVLERRVPTRRSRSSEGRRTWACRLATFVRLPLVYVMAMREFMSVSSQ